MKDLLTRTLDAHGGLSRWREIEAFQLKVSIGGGLWRLKGLPDGLRAVTLRVQAHRPIVTITPFGGEARTGHFTADRVWIEDANGGVVVERATPRASFAGHVLTTPWDKLHELYFVSYALWNYLATPFVFTEPGFETREIGPHEENGETWHRLLVKYPPSIPTHCAEQVLYFNAQGLLQRMDYSVDVVGDMAAGATAHYCFDHTPFGGKKFLEIEGRRMAYIDEGEGAPIVFAHGNPTSSYLWRNVMPACRGLGRLIACDMIGMGDSEKLPDSGPDRYTYAEQRSFLFALWKKLGVDKDVVFVLHDAGALLGFDWTCQHPERVQGIAYMEALVQPITWADFPEDVRSLVQGCRSKDGETLVLEKNLIVENVLPGAILRRLSEDEMAAYRAPFANAGEDRRPTLTWLRQIPIEGETPEVVRVAADCGRWLADSRIPKLFINAEPGAVLTGRRREFCRTWRNQTEVTVEGIHFVQEDSPEQIGKALAAFVRSLRSGPLPDLAQSADNA